MTISECRNNDVPIYLLPAARIAESRVSRSSLFRDQVWQLGEGTAGTGALNLIWEFEMPDGLIDLAKRFILSVRMNCQRGKNPKDASLHGLFQQLRYLLRWMSKAGHANFSDLDPGAAREFLEYLEEDKVACDREKKTSGQTIAKYLDVLCCIYEQSPLFAGFPAAIMPSHPFGGRTAYDMAATIAARTDRHIPPVPDEVWLCTVKAALGFLGAPARDVERLGRRLACLGNPPDDDNHFTIYRNKVIDEFEFDDDGALSTPWRPRLALPARKPGHGTTIGQRRRQRGLSTIFRKVLRDVRNACTIVIQATMGLRVSELAGLRVGRVDPITGWPSCLVVRPSRTGSNEVFYVRGRLFKQRDTWQEVEWVAGLRPAGSDYLPPPVEAILALHAVFGPWRSLGNRDELIVSLGRCGGLPRSAHAVHATLSDDLCSGQQEFVDDHVELPPGFEGYRFSTHQWRKSFALYYVRSDERLLSAVSHHFQHMSIAMTEQGYVGNDPELLGLIDDMATREAARALFEVVTGKSVASGKMKEIMERNAASIVSLCQDGADDAARVELLADVLRDDDVRAWTSPWGACFFRPESALCHRALGAFDLSARRPHYAERRPNVCSACPNLLVMEAHAGFWQDRHAANIRALADGRKAGEQALAAVAAERLKASTFILDRLDASLRKRREEAPDAR